MKHVSIIILNWQHWKDTLNCLNSVKKLTYPGTISIIVCDNASQNDSFVQILNWAQQFYSPSDIGVFKQPPSTSMPLPFVLIQTGANLGFAGGYNVGIHYALATQKYDYLWLLNNDTQVDAQALTALCDYAISHPHVALIGSTLLEFYEKDIVQCAGGCRYFPLLTIFRQIGRGQPLTTVMRWKEDLPLDYIAGASMFLKVSAVQQVGLLNEEYFLFYEELDYTQRLKHDDYQIGWCKQSFVYHKGSASIGSVHEGNRDKLRRANYYENLSTLKYTKNFYPQWLILVMGLRFVLKSLALISRGDFYLFAPLWQAYRDFIYQHKNNSPDVH